MWPSLRLVGTKAEPSPETEDWREGRQAQLRDNLFGLLALGTARVCQHGGHMLRLGEEVQPQPLGDQQSGQGPRVTLRTLVEERLEAHTHHACTQQHTHQNVSINNVGKPRRQASSFPAQSALPGIATLHPRTPEAAQGTPYRPA